jgi:RimJ/RimL family protein N-acetyltransferase
MSLPRLTGPRVTLVPVSSALARAVVDGTPAADPLAALGLRAAAGYPHEDSPDAFRPLAEHGEHGDDGGWLIAVDGEVVGDCGWQTGPDADGEVSIGYGLAVPSRRQGIGTEAVAVLCAWTEAQPGVRRLVADVRVGNEASRRLLLRLGFTEAPAEPGWVRCLRGEGQPAIAGRHVC